MNIFITQGLKSQMTMTEHQRVYMYYGHTNKSSSATMSCQFVTNKSSTKLLKYAYLETQNSRLN